MAVRCRRSSFVSAMRRVHTLHPAFTSIFPRSMMAGAVGKTSSGPRFTRINRRSWGALLDAVAGGLRELPSIRLPAPPAHGRLRGLWRGRRPGPRMAGRYIPRGL